MGLSLADSSEIPTRLTLFRIGDDGELTFARSYDCLLYTSRCV